MRFDTLLLASLPGTLGLQLAYAPPPAIMAKAAAADNDCTLPGAYTVKNFRGGSNGTALTSFDFGFVDAETKVTTLCHFNSSSESTTPGTLTPRYACENGEVKFIWEDDEEVLTMVERVCPGDDATPDYEVSGSINLPLTCGAPRIRGRGTGSTCSTNSTLDAKFTSLQPVRDPTLV